MTGPAGWAGGAKAVGGAGLKFWSDVTVPGRPNVLAIDACADANGWEADSASRVVASLTRRDIPVATGGPIAITDPDQIGQTLAGSDDYNAILLFARADHGPGVASFWEALRSELQGEEKLLAVCTWDSSDESTAREILESPETFAHIAIAQQTPLTVRGAGLFFMKFFAEVDLHSETTESMTGKMIWFGHSKAREILRRRKYDGRVGLRC